MLDVESIVHHDCVYLSFNMLLTLFLRSFFHHRRPGGCVGATRLHKTRRPRADGYIILVRRLSSFEGYHEPNSCFWFSVALAHVASALNVLPSVPLNFVCLQILQVVAAVLQVVQDQKPIEPTDALGILYE